MSCVPSLKFSEFSTNPFLKSECKDGKEVFFRSYKTVENWGEKFDSSRYFLLRMYVVTAFN